MKTTLLQDLLLNSNPVLCCLCLNKITEESPMQINCEIHLNPEECSGNTVLMFDMIKCVLQREDFISTSVCNSCLLYTLNAYKFIKMCTENAKRLTKFVDGVTNCLEKQDEKQIQMSHRVFIATNANSLQSMLNYDKKKELPHKEGYSELQCTMSRFQTIGCFPETVRKFMCDSCGTVCSKKRYLLEHIRKNCNKKAEKTTCNICSKLVSTRSITRHMRTCGNPTKKLKDYSYLCNICGKYDKNIKRHMATHLGHSFECKKCNKKYKNVESYKQHIKNKTCQKTQKDLSEAKVHKCYNCDALFISLHNLKVHMKIHSDNKSDYYECSWCQKRCSSRSQLTTHSVTHTKEKNWPCTICGGKFVSKASLTYHVRTHTGEKPFKCELCEKTFLNASRRREHMRKEHLPPLLECKYCHKSFKLHNGLSKHQRRHLDPKSSIYVGKKQLKLIKDGNKDIPTSKTKTYLKARQASVKVVKNYDNEEF